MVEVAERTTVDRLLQLRLLGEVRVKTTVPRNYPQHGDLVKGVPLWHTDAELTYFLQQDRVIAARRLSRRQRKPGEAAPTTNCVVLTFRPNTYRPSRAYLVFTKHDKHLVMSPNIAKEPQNARDALSYIPPKTARKKHHSSAPTATAITQQATSIVKHG